MKTTPRAIKLTGRMKVVYPVGTALKEIAAFDRSTHVSFKCPTHSESEYFSKDPFSSNIFIANGWANECNCPMGEHVTTKAYTA